jgi:hypothetical protein
LDVSIKSDLISVIAQLLSAQDKIATPGTQASGEQKLVKLKSQLQTKHLPNLPKPYDYPNDVFRANQHDSSEDNSTALDQLQYVSNCGCFTWRLAFEALRSLVERTGDCGYPRWHIRGNRATSRFEFAAD